VRLRPEIITQILIPTLVLPRHLGPTAPAVDDALEQRGPLAWHPTALVVCIGGIVVIQNGLNTRKRLPRHVGRVPVVHDHLPLCERQSTLLGATTARLSLPPRLAVDKGARIGRIPQDGNDRRYRGGAPDRLTVARATGQAQPLVTQQADHLARGSPRKKRLEDQGNRLLHRPVGVFDDAPLRVA
jgi:hypothetical protein